MYISSVVIKNFRNFKDISIDLPPQAIIVGENSIGKSNLLHALRLVLDPTLPNSERQLSDEDFNSNIKFRGQSIEIEVRLKGFECQKQVHSLLCDYLESDKPEPVALLRYVYRPKESIQPADALDTSSYRWGIYGPKKLDTKKEVSVRQLVLQLIQIAYLGALRDVASDLSSWRKSPLRPLISQIGLPKSLLESVVTDLKKAAEPVLGHEEIIRLNKEIVDALVDMIGTEYGINPQIDISSTTSEKLLRLFTLLAETGRTADETSTGLASVLYIILWLTRVERQERLFRKGQGQDEPTSTIIALEEPESHLHPHLQRLVFRTLFSAERSERQLAPDRLTPIIVTTHSPHITSVAPLNSLVRLYRHNDNIVAVSAANILPKFDKREQEALERFLDVTRNEILFAKRVILVEGTAEQFIVAKFAELLYQRPSSEHDPRVLDKLGITVCAVQSTNFEPFVRLLSSSGFSIPFVVLTDGDPIVSEDGEMEYMGISRAIKLAHWVNSSAITDPTTLEKSKDLIDIRAALAESGIFVGEFTLEADLWLAGAQLEIIAALQRMGASEHLIAMLRTDLERTDLSLFEKTRKLIQRIEYTGGKGRFAQTLAPILKLQHAPKYIVDALRHLSQDWQETEQVI